MALMANDRQLLVPPMRKMDSTTFSPVPWRQYAWMNFRRDEVLGLKPQDEVDEFITGWRWVGSVEFLDDDHVVVSGERPFLAIWQYKKENVARLPAEANVTGMALASDGSAAVARWSAPLGPRRLEAMVYFPKTHAPPVELKGHTDEIIGQAMSPDGKRCAIASKDKTARIWTVADPTHPIELNHPGPVYNVAFSADGKTVATSDFGGLIRLWNAETGASLGSPFGKEQKNGRCRLKFLPDGKTLIAGTIFDHTIRRWNLESRKSVELVLDGDTFLAQIGVSPDGKWLAVGRSTGELDFVAVDGLKPVCKRFGHYESINGIAFSPDSTLLATGSLDSMVKLWSVKGLSAR